MTARRCTWNVGNGPRERCPDDAEWVFTYGTNVRLYSCERHLPDTEREYPEAMILPLDTENH